MTSLSSRVPGVAARLVDAGHILGSAAVVLDVEEQGRKLRLGSAGILGRSRLPLIRDPILPDGVDYLMMECTYGDKPHRDPELAYEELRQVAGRTLEPAWKGDHPGFCRGAHAGDRLCAPPDDRSPPAPQCAGVCG